MSDPELSPEQETRVRDLLAAARYDEPVPGDVAARLDRVLAGLAAEEAPGSTGVPGSTATGSAVPSDATGSTPAVADLAARRRRRGSWLLAAAACLVAGGVGAGQLLSESSGDLAESADSSAGGAAEEAASGEAEDADALPQGAVGSSVVPAPTPTAAAPVRVEEGRFARDAARILAGRTDAAELSSKSSRSAAADAPAAAWFSCDPAPWGPGRLVAVEYAGEPAVLAFRTPAGDTRVVDLLECGTGTVLRSVTLPVS